MTATAVPDPGVLDNVVAEKFVDLSDARAAVGAPSRAFACARCRQSSRGRARAPPHYYKTGTGQTTSGVRLPHPFRHPARLFAALRITSTPTVCRPG
ncbi:MAG: hypothetical protein FWD68_17645 [Alphaproteobacteria bacterium]|nr:hypothetical protein [Alphaproteobacteria bacterium]